MVMVTAPDSDIIYSCANITDLTHYHY